MRRVALLIALSACDSASSGAPVKSEEDVKKAEWEAQQKELADDRSARLKAEEQDIAKVLDPFTTRASAWSEALAKGGAPDCRG